MKFEINQIIWTSCGWEVVGLGAMWEKENTEESGKSKFSVMMEDNESVQVIRKEQLTLEDKLGIKIDLRDTRVVKGMETNIVSLLQLVY